MALSSEYYLRRSGHIVQPVLTPFKQAMRDQHRRILEMARAGEETSAIMNHLGISYSLVWKVCKAAGVRLIRNGSQQQCEKAARAQALRVSGMTLEQVGIAMGITRERVRQLTGSMVFEGICEVCDDPFEARTAGVKTCSQNCWRQKRLFGLEGARAQLEARRQKQALIDAGYRRCYLCHRNLLASEFTGKIARCRSCNQENQRKYYVQKRAAKMAAAD